MKDLTKHISSLLYQHDCVIIPGVGGFLVHQTQGKFDRDNHRLNPPSRSVTFNGLLTNDDGLLTSWVCQQEQIDYALGKEMVNKFALKLLEESKSGTGAKMEGIGTLIRTGEGKMRFNPLPGTNFLDESYGLTPVMVNQVPIQLRHSSQKREAKARTDRKPQRSHEKTPGSVKWTVITSAPIILFLLWGILFPATFQHYYTSYSGLLTDLVKLNHATVVDDHVNPDIITKEAQYQDESVSIQPIADQVTDLPLPIKEELASSENMEAVQEDIQQTEPELMYHVIGGVFRNEENAIKYADALVTLGYRSKLVGTNKLGLFRVSYDSFASWAEAEKFLDTIRTSENPSAWILKY